MKKELPASGVFCDESVKAVQRIPDESIHLILSDIPYGIGAEAWDVLHANTNTALLGKSPAQAKAGGIFDRRGKPINGWSAADKAIPIEYYDWCMTWAKDWLRILKPGASAIVFAGRRLGHRCTAAMEDSGFNYKDMLSWEKRTAPHRAQRLSAVFDRRGDAISSAQWAGWRLGNLRPTFEPILWFTKPYKVGTTITDNVLTHSVGAINQTAYQQYSERTENIIRASFEPNEQGYHPTQKPIRLMAALIEMVTVKKQWVLDPFCGSGSTLVAAKRLGRRYVGIGIDPGYIRIANSRLGQAPRQCK